MGKTFEILASERQNERKRERDRWKPAEGRAAQVNQSAKVTGRLGETGVGRSIYTAQTIERWSERSGRDC